MGKHIIIQTVFIVYRKDDDFTKQCEKFDQLSHCNHLYLHVLATNMVEVLLLYRHIEVRCAIFSLQISKW